MSVFYCSGYISFLDSDIHGCEELCFVRMKTAQFWIVLLTDLINQLGQHVKNVAS